MYPSRRFLMKDFQGGSGSHLSDITAAPSVAVFFLATVLEDVLATSSLVVASLLKGYMGSPAASLCESSMGLPGEAVPMLAFLSAEKDDSVLSG